MDPLAKYETFEYFIDKQGKWNPQADQTGAGNAYPEKSTWSSRCCTGRLARTARFWFWLELAEFSLYVGAGVMASAVSMDKEDDETQFCAERMLPVVDYVTVTREKPDCTKICDALSCFRCL